MKRLIRALLLAATAAFGLAWSNTPMVAQSGAQACGIDARILVIAADGTEADLPAIRQALEYLGTPYDVYVATAHSGGLGASTLSSGCRAFYQGVIVTTDGLFYQSSSGYISAFSAADFQTLIAFEQAFGIRQVTWYAYPTPDLGFNYPSSASAADVSATLTTAGQEVFPYVNSGPGSTPIPIRQAWTYLTTVLDSATVPLLTDGAGHALAALHTYPDGRQNLVMTFDSNQYLVHAMILSYGLIKWVSGGIFIGDRHVYMSPQVDDVFIDDMQWLTSTACGTNVDQTGVQQRITGQDLMAV